MRVLRKMKFLCAGIFGVATAVLLAGCENLSLNGTSTSQVSPPTPSNFQAPTLAVQNPDQVKYYPSDEPLKVGLEYFDRGYYGIAAKHFENAVEQAPKDATAWVGLAASYDRIGRFDLADRAYRQAIRLVGETTAILNNQGYSYMLRGRIIEARRKFLKAYEREPTNPTVLNNLKLLDGSERYIRRDSQS